MLNFIFFSNPPKQTVPCKSTAKGHVVIPGTPEHGTPEHPGTPRNTRNSVKNPEHPETPSRKPGTPSRTFTYPKKAWNTPPARRYYHHA